MPLFAIIRLKGVFESKVNFSFMRLLPLFGRVMFSLCRKTLGARLLNRGVFRA